MNKLLSIAFMITTYSSLFSSNSNSDIRCFKNGNEEFKVCNELDNEYEECVSLPLEEVIKIFKLEQENTKEAKKLITNMLIARIRHLHLNLKRGDTKKTVLKSTNNSLHQLSEEDVRNLTGFSINHKKRIQETAEDVLYKFQEKNSDDEYIRSLLPKEEQKMFDAIKNFLKRDFTNK